MNAKKYGKIAYDGLITNNATFKLVLGTCATLAMSTSAINSFGMGISVTVVLLLSNVLISLLRKVIPNTVRIPAFVVIIATMVTLLRMVLDKYIPDLYDSMGVFLPLIVVNCVILGRAEAFASKNPVLDSAIDGIATGLGLTFALTFIGIIREFLGSGSFFGIQVMDFKIGFFTNSAGAFFVYGICIALFVLVTNKMEQARRVRKMRTLRMPAGDEPLPPVSETTEKEGN
ncbi:MAG TPA: electron transport complex subunit E [Candidatus Gallimonas intestinigallinarum]|uniref:Ion-translocating oxidoreductase complex subunit E n=1 Tax=Candidatus Gallimonas intestinigallinarum TaxID=2838604 RepID=A0A9D2DWK0_9FIRM|nr:electron transport complex subunit E [Candidatus Gallimonas intestinigallinarum]